MKVLKLVLNKKARQKRTILFGFLALLLTKQKGYMTEHTHTHTHTYTHEQFEDNGQMHLCCLLLTKTYKCIRISDLIHIKWQEMQEQCLNNCSQSKMWNASITCHTIVVASVATLRILKQKVCERERERWQTEMDGCIVSSR